jgi:photosystem II stability/assembly factor-like uncharacterized protein
MNAQWNAKIIGFATVCFFIGTDFCLGEGGWQLVREPALDADRLESVHFIDPQNGWAVGFRGGILHTKDGGATWTARQITLPLDARTYDIFFVNLHQGYIVGSQGLIFHTTDGGNTWKRQLSGTPEDFHKIVFVNEDEGWIVGMWGGILHTQNGGEDWSMQARELNLRWLFGLEFVDSQRGWVGGQLGVLLHTEDGGEHWEKQDGDFDYRFWGIDFVTPYEGWAAGVTTFPNLNLDDPGVLLYTKDGGKHWTRNEMFPKGEWPRSVLFVNPEEGWAFTWDKIFHTRDRGQTWTTQFQSDGIFDLAFDGEHTLWAVGGNGRIWKYTDSALRAYAVKPVSNLFPTQWGKIKNERIPRGHVD